LRVVGYLIEQGGWKMLSFPAIAEDDETFVIRSRYTDKGAAGPLEKLQNRTHHELATQ
jgi:hypothetical protein